MSKKSWLHHYINMDDAAEIFPVRYFRFLDVIYNNHLHAIELMVKYGISYVRAQSIFILTTILYLGVPALLIWLLTVLIQDSAVIAVIFVTLFIIFIAFLLPICVKKFYVKTGILPTVQSESDQVVTRKAIDDGLLIKPQDRQITFALQALTILGLLSLLLAYVVITN